jgi:hypothetical protein
MGLYGRDGKMAMLDSSSDGRNKTRWKIAVALVSI